MNPALNYIVNPKKFFAEIISQKKDNRFVVYLVISCTILAAYDLRFKQLDNNNSIGLNFMIMGIDLIIFPISLYLISYVVDKIQIKGSKKKSVDELFHVIGYAILPIVVVAFCRIFFPEIKYLSTLMQVALIWSFVIWAIGLSYVKKIGVFQSMWVTVIPLIIMILLGKLIGN